MFLLLVQFLTNAGSLLALFIIIPIWRIKDAYLEPL